MEIRFPEYVQRVISILEINGFEAFLVGGSIRNILLGIEPKDYDIATDADPDKICEIFSDFKTLNVGKKFGTIVVVQREGDIEITTYRTEGKYTDGRRPDEVKFSKNIEEDLSRRDFTINAMAYNVNSGLVDPFDGKFDLEKGIIRTVGNPEERFREDYLRMLRAVRFSSQLEFELEDNTSNYCKELSSRLKHISMERIREELFKILLSRKPSNGIRLMLETNMLEIIIPELIKAVGLDQRNPNHNRTLFEHILCVTDNAPPILEIRMAALLHDVGKPDTFSIDEKGKGHFFDHDRLGAEMTKEILTRLKCSTEFIEKVVLFVREHMFHSSMKDKGLKRLLGRVGEENIFHLFELQRADMSCKAEGKDTSLIDERILKAEEIIKNREPFKKNHLKIDGNDIIGLGMSPGTKIGEILDYLLEQVISRPEYNSREKLIDMAKNMITNNK